MPFLLAHLSDPHLPPLPSVRPLDLAGKRALGYLNWIRNRRAIHRREVLDAVIADMRAQSPDHIAVTGDIVNLALEAEFAPARRWIAGVGPPDRVTLVPGNHDAYVRPTQNLFARSFADYLRADDATSQGFPLLRRRGPLALIGVSSAVPTPPLMATGRLGQAQRDALARLLEHLGDDDACRVLLIHHPLRSTARFKRLTDAPELLAILKRHGVELVLHGHDHVHSHITIDGPRGPIPVIGVPSASAVAHGATPAAAYNLFSIDRGPKGWTARMSVRGISATYHVGDHDAPAVGALRTDMAIDLPPSRQRSD